ncbi:glucokinase [Candidatus Leptofilum sp.]|uniref:glucokinase n=1 Tax=Candidatus Leptofilum sp. TaxID=3241576 RepID=UPI003B5960EF
MLLAGDIGGTKTVLALFSTAVSVESRHPLHLQTFPSGRFTSLEAIIAQFLQDKAVGIEAASFGVAGPVVNGRSQITNLPWIIDAATISQTFGIEHVALLNDLEAIANAVPHLQTDDLATINEGQVEPSGAIAVIAPGTGLGEAFLTWDGQRYQAHPSEGGHASFAPTNAEQRALQAYLEQKFDHVSFERVCSGSGIPNLYEFWRQDGRFQEPEWLREQIVQADDPTPVIVEAGLAKTADICTATVQLFVDILAAEASNMALKVLATGGVYLGGGIPPRLLNLLQTERFISEFGDKGRFSSLLLAMPVQVICNPQVALLGTAWAGMDLLHD